MTRWKYWRLCARRTLKSAWGMAGQASTLLTVLGVVGSLWIPFGEIMSILVWLLPLVALVATLFIGLLVTSYRMYQESEQAARIRESELTNRVRQLESLQERASDPERVRHWLGHYRELFQRESVVPQLCHYLSSEPAVCPVMGVPAKVTFGSPPRELYAHFWGALARIDLFKPLANGALHSVPREISEKTRLWPSIGGDRMLSWLSMLYFFASDHKHLPLRVAESQVVTYGMRGKKIKNTIGCVSVVKLYPDVFTASIFVIDLLLD